MEEIDAATLRERLQQQAAIAIDVRRPDEFRAGHIPGALLNPVTALDITPLPQDRQLVLYCGSSGRAGQAAEILRASGFHQLALLKGGLAAWKQAGFETERTQA